MFEKYLVDFPSVKMGFSYELICRTDLEGIISFGKKVASAYVKLGKMYAKDQRAMVKFFKVIPAYCVVHIWKHFVEIGMSLIKDFYHDKYNARTVIMSKIESPEGITALQDNIEDEFQKNIKLNRKLVKLTEEERGVYSAAVTFQWLFKLYLKVLAQESITIEGLNPLIKELGKTLKGFWNPERRPLLVDCFKINRHLFTKMEKKINKTYGFLISKSPRGYCVTKTKRR
jgi:hypothetical protein